jgi:putative hemolysin
MFKKISQPGIILLALAVVIAGCAPQNVTPDESAVENLPLEKSAEKMDMPAMANPAAVYCEGLGYGMENVQRNAGSDADCIFLDGTQCGQWDFLSGRCGHEFTYCEMQAGTIEEGANILTCRFSDGSTCDEYQYFLGNCVPGDNPGEVSEEDVVEIHDFAEARDFLAAYFLTQYGIEHTESWMEENITPENAGSSSTYRYVSGPLAIVITAEAAAPYAPMYTIDQASYIANGFYWKGTLTFNGTVTETLVYPPGTVLNTEQARDAVLEYLGKPYDLNAFGEWTDEGYSHTDDPASATSWKTFTSAPWIVKVEFEPSAPLVAKYHVTVENISTGLRWEGEITLRGEIEEVSLTQSAIGTETQEPNSFMTPGAEKEITDWWGVIKSTEPGAQYDDYFERQDLGQIIYFGIESLDPAVQAQIEALRDSGKIVHMYGTLLSNVPDYTGSQIRVDRIEIEE